MNWLLLLCALVAVLAVVRAGESRSEEAAIERLQE